MYLLNSIYILDHSKQFIIDELSGQTVVIAMVFCIQLSSRTKTGRIRVDKKRLCNIDLNFFSWFSTNIVTCILLVNNKIRILNMNMQSFCYTSVLTLYIPIKRYYSNMRWKLQLETPSNCLRKCLNQKYFKYIKECNENERGQLKLPEEIVSLKRSEARVVAKRSNGSSSSGRAGLKLAFNLKALRVL